MQLQSTRQSLRDFDLRTLFIEELGWEGFKKHQAQLLDIEIGGRAYRLTSVARKQGMIAYAYDADPGRAIPDYATRHKIEKKVTEAAYEHIIAYRDSARRIWQWVKREPGKPDRNREHVLYGGQSPDALLRKLNLLAVALEDDEDTNIAAMAGKARRAFDVEGVTKKFYDRFQKDHGRFLSFIEGIRSVAGREWYASLMLNRLMFIYFMQKRGFLDGDPYLNGGLFEVHGLEQANADIHIPDKAFEDIFAFFDAYDWTLDQRPPRTNTHRRDGRTELKDEINPDVLGYIFEKYINQKQMGAYYTALPIKSEATEQALANALPTENPLLKCYSSEARSILTRTNVLYGQSQAKDIQSNMTR